MNRIAVAKAAIDFAKVRFLNRRIPLAVRWQLTNACEARCLFCNLYKTPAEIMDTARIESILDELAALGTKLISFSGGEPLLRPDIGRIIRHTKKLGISASMNTNGALIKERIDDLRESDLLKITLQGPREIHCQIQGETGLFDRLMEGLEVAHRAGVRFSFATTVTKYNVNDLDFVLKTAETYKTFVAFQPLKNLYRGIENTDAIAPTRDEFRKAIDKLIEQKRAGNRHIRNSLRNLEHIIHWPEYPELKCWAGRLFVIIETDGEVKPCDRIAYKNVLPNLHNVTMAEAMESLPEELDCKGCGFCGALELNFAGRLDLRTFRIIRRVV